MTNKQQAKRPGRPKKVTEPDLSRWTILIPWETRIAVTKAAKRANIPLNTWINKTLAQTSQEALKGKHEVARPDDVMDVIKQMADKIDMLSVQVNKPWWKKISK